MSETFSGRARETPALCVSRPRITSLCEADLAGYRNSLTIGGCIQIKDLERVTDYPVGVASMNRRRSREAEIP